MSVKGSVSWGADRGLKNIRIPVYEDENCGLNRKDGL